nr:glucosaminidase domain-containing protein [Paenibacillus sp. Soil787]
MSKESFIDQLASAARADMREFGILASVTIAQAILESGWGRSAHGNNLFGIKGSGQQ